MTNLKFKMTLKFSNVWDYFWVLINCSFKKLHVINKFHTVGMDKGESTAEDIEKLKKMVPKAYQKYIESKLNKFNY